MHGRHWHGDGWHDGWGWTGPLMMLLLWLLLAVSIFALLRGTGMLGRGRKPEPSSSQGGRGPAAGSPTTAEAERILHERFARGEIDEADYTRRHELLKERSGVPPS